MFKTFTLAMLGAFASAQMGPNGYSRGIPPVTQSCRGYPKNPDGTDNVNAQAVAWGLTVDREFGGCRCADEDEMEFQPNPDTNDVNSWACYCLNNDLYLDQPVALTTVSGTGVLINDANGKKCGVISECQSSAIGQQRIKWNQEVARADQQRENAKSYAKKSMMPDDEINRARILRVKMTKQNKSRARAQIAGLAVKYRALKDAMTAGHIERDAFEKAYALTA